MTTIPAGARKILATGPLAHVVTLDPDGTPQVTLAWAGFDGDQVLLSSFFDQRKLDNLRRDPRITLSFEAHESGGERLHPYLVVSGRAHVTAGGALDVMDQLAEYYIGPGRRYGWREGPPGFTIRVDVDRIYGVGSWRGSEDDAEDEG